MQNEGIYYNAAIIISYMTHELSLWIKKLVILIALGVLLYLLYRIGSIVFVILISGFLTIILNPIISLGEKHKIPAWISLIGVYIIIIILGSIVIGTLIPIVIAYVTDTINTITVWANQAKEIYLLHGIE